MIPCHTFNDTLHAQFIPSLNLKSLKRENTRSHKLSRINQRTFHALFKEVNISHYPGFSIQSKRERERKRADGCVSEHFPGFSFARNTIHRFQPPTLFKLRFNVNPVCSPSTPESHPGAGCFLIKEWKSVSCSVYLYTHNAKIRKEEKKKKKRKRKNVATSQPRFITRQLGGERPFVTIWRGWISRKYRGTLGRPERNPLSSLSISLSSIHLSAGSLFLSRWCFISVSFPRDE